MQDHPTNRAERQTSARILAIELNNRAWELIERQTRTLSEVIEMLDAAHGSRALWFLVCEHADSIERLRAHHVVACACARAHLGDQAIQAARMAVEFERAYERDHGGAVGHFDQAMTLVSMQLASLKLPGAPRVEPLMGWMATLRTTLHPDELAVLSRLLPWPQWHFQPTPQMAQGAA